MEDRIFENIYQKEKYLLLTFNYRDTIIRRNDIERLLSKKKGEYNATKSKVYKTRNCGCGIAAF